MHYNGAMSPLLPSSPLHGWGVVVTRPAAQASALCDLLRSQGAQVWRFPTLAIEPAADIAPALAIIERLADYDIAIFISANAVEQALGLIGSTMPAGLRLAVIGKASAEALRRFGLQPQLVPAHTFNSEALLERPELQSLAGRSIVIFRGEGGRTLLGDTLRERGARVDYAEVYQRVRPGEYSADELLNAWNRGKIQAVTATSNETLQNLFDMLGQEGRAWLLATPLVVVSRRAAELARQLGFSAAPEVTDEAGDQAMLAALIRLRHRLEAGYSTA
jgi:uroporphyrinogen-III synthase